MHILCPYELSNKNLDYIGARRRQPPLHLRSFIGQQCLPFTKKQAYHSKSTNLNQTSAKREEKIHIAAACMMCICTIEFKRDKGREPRPNL